METYIQIQKKHRVPNKINPERSTARHTAIKMPKVKDKKKIFLNSKRKTTNYI